MSNPARVVYVTIRCPGCGIDSEWLGMFEAGTFPEPAGGTRRYVPGECGCGVEVAA